MLGKLTVLAVAVLLALGAGYGLGYLVFQPRIDSLRGTQEEQVRELDAVKGQLDQRGTAAEDVLARLNELRGEHAGLGVEVEASKADLAQVRSRLAEAQDALKTAQTDLSASREARDAAEAQVQDLAAQAKELEEAPQSLDAAIKVQAEIMAIVSEKMSPALADAAILARRGFQAIDRQNYSNVVGFFEDASAAYSEAKQEAEVTPEKAKELASLVPEEERDPFTLAHKHAEGRFRALSSRVPEFRAAAKLYQVIAEWDDQDRKGTPEDIERWRDVVIEAEEQIEEAMGLLDEADDWAPDLWREFEAQRLEVQEWRGLVDGIRATVLEE